MRTRRLIGVLGGMGPMATVEFMRKVIELTPAEVDQDHVPMIVHCVPQIPDRVSAILERRDDPLAALIVGAAKLVDAGAEVIVMPCHTAHAWFAKLARSVSVPMLHIAETALRDLDTLAPQPRRVALLGTLGTLRAGIYQDMLAKHGRDFFVPDEGTQACVLAAIASVKRNDLKNARTQAAEALDRLVQAQCDAALLACTELPLAVDALHSPLQLINPTDSLAKACVEFSCHGQRHAL